MAWRSLELLHAPSSQGVTANLVRRPDVLYISWVQNACVDARPFLAAYAKAKERSVALHSRLCGHPSGNVHDAWKEDLNLAPFFSRIP